MGLEEGGGRQGWSVAHKEIPSRQKHSVEEAFAEASFSGEIRLLESAHGKRIATENSARNNPRRNNATRQIVLVEIFVLTCVLLKIRRLCKLLHRESEEFRERGIFHDILIHFSTPMHFLIRIHNRIFILPKDYTHNLKNSSYT